MGPKTFGTRYTRQEGWDDECIRHPNSSFADDLIISDDMTKDQKTATKIENMHRQNANRLANACADNTDYRSMIEKIIFGSEQHEYFNDASPVATMFGAPKTYIYPRYDPGCSDYQYQQIRDYPFPHRKGLAFDSLYFHTPEHILLAYIARLGSHLEAKWWRGFLLECDRRGELFR
jgi:hypothetical protein